MDKTTIQRTKANDIDFTTAEFPTHYAQEAIVGSSFYDFSLVFIQNSIRGKNPVASITFPPAMAKQLASILQSNVERYEQTYGEIKLPQNQGAAVEGGIS